jgi:hypothetical protein
MSHAASQKLLFKDSRRISTIDDIRKIADKMSEPYFSLRCLTFFAFF